MTATQLLAEAFDRIASLVSDLTEGADEAELARRPADTGNSPAWLVWHLTRVQDDHVSELAGREQVWTSQGFADRFDLPFEAEATGYGQSDSEVASVRVDPQRLAAYHRAVHAMTAQFLDSASDADLDRVVDDSFDPPVTAGARLVSVVADDLQHAGQAAYALGLDDR